MRRVAILARRMTLIPSGAASPRARRLIVALALIGATTWIARPAQSPTAVAAQPATLGSSPAVPGSPWGWGTNTFGQLGFYTTASCPNVPTIGTACSPAPGQINGLSDVTALGGGFDYALALRADGTVWAWGDGDYGQLGNGSIISSTTPVQVSTLTNVVAIAARSHFNLALESDGTVWAWGDDDHNQLGVATTETCPVGGVTYACSSSPMQVPGMSDVTAIAAGRQHSLALRSDGTVWAWGDDTCGQLGMTLTVPLSSSIPYGSGCSMNGPSATSPFSTAAPAPVTALNGTPITAIAAGRYGSLAIASNGAVWTWGDNSSGELGNGQTAGFSTVPAPVNGLFDVQAIAAGWYHDLALRADGTVWAWGDNTSGELSAPSSATCTNGSCSTVPREVSALTSVSAIAGGAFHSMALRTDGTVWAWGDDYEGQLGNGASANSVNRPVEALGLNNIDATEQVKVYWDSAVSTALTTTTTAAGGFVVRLAVPPATYGVHALIAVGQDSGRVATAPLRVIPFAFLARASGVGGSQNVLQGFGFCKQEIVRAYWTPGNLPLGPTVGISTTLQGAFIGASAITFTVPLSPTGTYHVVAVGQNSHAISVATFHLASA